MTRRTPSFRRRAGATRPSLVVAALTLCALLSAGCASPPPGPDAEELVRGTVLRYNRLLAEGYRTMDMDRLRQVADELQAEDEYIHMSSLAEGGVRLLPYLKHFEFLSVHVEGSSARVETRETWDFLHEGRESRVIVLEQRDLTYEVAWDLAAAGDGRWYVTDVRVMSSTSTVPPSLPTTAAATDPRL